MNTSITSLMHADHQKCDQLLASAEEKLFAGDKSAAIEKINEFITTTLHHLQAEEELLFPAFEAKTGMAGGPTQVMRMEHDQMRGLMKTLKEATVDINEDKVGSITETIMILMQQHNLKEENMLYPMMDNVFVDEKAELIQKINEIF